MNWSDVQIGAKIKFETQAGIFLKGVVKDRRPVRPSNPYRQQEMAFTEWSDTLSGWLEQDWYEKYATLEKPHDWADSLELE